MKREFCSLEKMMSNLTRSKIHGIIDKSGQVGQDIGQQSSLLTAEQDSKSKTKLNDIESKAKSAAKQATNLLQSKLNVKRATNPSKIELDVINKASSTSIRDNKQTQPTEAKTPVARIAAKGSIFTMTKAGAKLSKKGSLTSVDDDQLKTPQRVASIRTTEAMIPLAEGVRQLGAGLSTQRFAEAVEHSPSTGPRQSRPYNQLTSIQYKTPSANLLRMPSAHQTEKSKSPSAKGIKEEQQVFKTFDMIKIQQTKPHAQASSEQITVDSKPDSKDHQTKEQSVPLTDSTFLEGMPKQSDFANFACGDSSILLTEESTIEAAQQYKLTDASYSRKNSDEILDLLKKSHQ